MSPYDRHFTPTGLSLHEASVDVIKNLFDTIVTPRMVSRKRRPALSSAEFNMREIVKQFLLLEDHLTDDEKFCVDCIRKHLMMVEGLAEESLALEPSGMWVGDAKRFASFARRVLIKFTDGYDRERLARSVRLVRKKLMARVYDPRGV